MALSRIKKHSTRCVAKSVFGRRFPGRVAQSNRAPLREPTVASGRYRERIIIRYNMTMLCVV
jgi:hypothetical protein